MSCLAIQHMVRSIQLLVYFEVHRINDLVLRRKRVITLPPSNLTLVAIDRL